MSFGSLGFLGLRQEIVDTPTYDYAGNPSGSVHQTVTYYDDPAPSPVQQPTPETPSTPVVTTPSTPVYNPPTPNVDYFYPVTPTTTTAINTTTAVTGAKRDAQNFDFFDAILGWFSPEGKDKQGNVINTGNIKNGNVNTTGQTVTADQIAWAQRWADIQNFATRNKTPLLLIGGVAVYMFLAGDD